MAKRRRKSVFSGIGGQAVLEGVMMRNRQEYAVAVRKPDGEISVDIKQLDYDPKSLKKRIPFIRGIFSFVESLTLGMDILSFSASFEEEEEDEKGKKSLMEKIFKDKAEDVVMGLTVLFSIAFAILLFMVLPYAVSEYLGKFIRNKSLILLIEGALRIFIFVLYVAGIALMKDIRRLYQYHGAEHKCINCVETGRPLTVKNVMKCSRFHKRCGTSFMLFIVVLGVILCFFIRTDVLWLKIAIRIALIPVLAGISYELLQLAGKKDNFLLSLISTPGLWLQAVTTKEPDEKMVEVAIAATEAVFDWEAFQDKHFVRKIVKKTQTAADGSEVETGDETMQIDVREIEDMLRSGNTGVINRNQINRRLNGAMNSGTAGAPGYDQYGNGAGAQGYDQYGNGAGAQGYDQYGNGAGAQGYDQYGDADDGQAYDQYHNMNNVQGNAPYGNDPNPGNRWGQGQ